MSKILKSTCRVCTAQCPVLVTVEDGKPVNVEGNREAPLYEGFTCPKGRAALAAAHNDPKRLRKSLKRQPDGSFTPIPFEQAVAEISEKLATILRRDGPRAVAGFGGAPGAEQIATAAMVPSFIAALGSPMYFNSGTFDQPGLMVADALHGYWLGGRMHPKDWDVFLLIGGNPIISKQYFGQNPGEQLKALEQRGTKLIVIDPRRTETAKRADVHLQAIPGQDPTILAGLLHLVFAEARVNDDFVEQNAIGLGSLEQAVTAFTPEYVAARAGINEDDLREAARILCESKAGDIGLGTGPSMATRGTLSSYLALCLQTLRGFWAREGDEEARPNVTLTATQPIAQPKSPAPAWGFGEKLRVRGLQESVAGMPSGGLPEEILTPGEGQVRALFLNAGAMMTWPQQELAKRALESLELLVIHDVSEDLSPSARMADYVIAAKLQFEVPSISYATEIIKLLHPGYGWFDPYAAYNPAILDPPEDSECVDSWLIYYRIAQRLGLQLRYGSLTASPSDRVALDMENTPTTDDLYELLCAESAVPLSTIKKYPNGHVFDEARNTVAPRDPACSDRLDLANETMLAELETVRNEPITGHDREFPFLLVPRRMQNVTNSVPRQPGLLKQPYNPAYMNPSDLARLGVHNGDLVEIRSKHGVIEGVVEVEEAVRLGVVSMSHGFGKNPGEKTNPRLDGANTNRLLRLDDDFDPYHGMPRMGAVPVRVTQGAA